jgi:protein-S-isoprenylcysteine O-methyltransferase Ste14
MTQRMYRFIFPGIWLTWAAYWLWAARQSKPDARREPLASRLLHELPLYLAVALLWSDRVPYAFLGVRLYPWSPWELWTAAAITALGLLFTVWARVHLGRNWSGVVTIKQGHDLVDTGPYALVRHPIYTGLLVAVLASGAARGDGRGLLAVLIAFAALWRKLRIEERWMTERFGEQYLDYCRRVPALVPFLKRRNG